MNYLHFIRTLCSRNCWQKIHAIQHLWRGCQNGFKDVSFWRRFVACAVLNSQHIQFIMNDQCMNLSTKNLLILFPRKELLVRISLQNFLLVSKEFTEGWIPKILFLSQKYVIPNIITARIRSMTGRLCFQFVCSQGGPPTGGAPPGVPPPPKFGQKCWTKFGTKNGQSFGQKMDKILDKKLDKHFGNFWRWGGVGGTPLAVTQEDCLV